VKGRTPKPTALRLLQGKAGHRPINRAEPRPAPGRPTCPRELSQAGRREWRYAVKELAGMGLLARADRAVIAGYAQSEADYLENLAWCQQNGSTVVMRDEKGAVKWIQEAPQWRMAQKHLEKVRQFAAELGLSPSARTRIHVQPREKENGIEQFLYGKT
jgi:P27 family predicted phage terminase small subunit